MYPLYCVLWLALLGLASSASLLDSSPDPCYRECRTGEPAMVCKYTFVEEIYTAMNSACGNCSLGVKADCSLPQCIQVDGVERTLYSINRMMPGPSINVCAGDVVEVDLQVKLPGHGDTIHWHGLRQMQTPYMDGVSMITQCPVMAGQAFRYRFIADDPGTHFYHTHNGVHKVNGAVGVIVVRQPRDSDPSAALFDRDLKEHTVFLMDWMHVDAEARYPGLNDPAGQFADSVLINGKGNYQNENGTWTRTPLADFPVQKGLRYRFRIINSGALSCPIVLSFVGHNMTIIATDSKDVEPLTVDTLFTWSGERYDVVVAADQDGDAFWIHAYQAGACASTAKDQVAVLRYSNDSTVLPASARPSVLQLQSRGLVMNAPSCGSPDGSLCVTDLRSAAAPEDDVLVVEPDNSTVVGVTFHTYSTEELFDSDTYSPFLRIGDLYMAGTINNVSFQMPASPLLTQPGDSPRCLGCPEGETHCTCTQVFPVALGDVHDIVMVDTTDVGSGGTAAMLSHPMHLHGYSFLVLGVGELANITNGQERRRYVQDNTALLRTATSRPPSKDTILLPAAGYAIVRILADNPGVWFFHCHFQYHMASGMEAAFQVGDAKDFVESPPNFPTCGDYMPVMT